MAPEGYWKINVDDVFSTETFTSVNIEGPYPNPAVNKVTFKLPQTNVVNNVSIYNILGQKIQEIDVRDNISFLELSLNNYESGLYIVHFSASEWSATKKFIKK